VGLASRAYHRPSRLSGGEQQRVAIARAIATDPSLVLADEPTGNLDSANAQHVLDLLASLVNRSTAVLLVTHDQGIAARTPRHIELLDGRIVGDRSAP
jgi:putative ABC transport system ATP-binding protein